MVLDVNWVAHVKVVIYVNLITLLYHDNIKYCLIKRDATYSVLLPQSLSLSVTDQLGEDVSRNSSVAFDTKFNLFVASVCTDFISRWHSEWSKIAIIRDQYDH